MVSARGRCCRYCGTLKACHSTCFLLLITLRNMQPGGNEGFNRQQRADTRGVKLCVECRFLRFLVFWSRRTPKYSSNSRHILAVGFCSRPPVLFLKLIVPRTLLRTHGLSCLSICAATGWLRTSAFKLWDCSVRGCCNLLTSGVVR
jgi:hypothetical protein